MAEPVTFTGLITGFVVLIWILGLLLIVSAIAGTVFWILMLIDCAKRTSDAKGKFDDKLIWMLVIILLHGLGAALYYFIIKRPADKKNRT